MKIKLDDYENEWKRKLENERARLDALRKQDEESNALRRKRIAEEEKARDDELRRLRQEIANLEEKLREKKSEE